MLWSPDGGGQWEENHEYQLKKSKGKGRAGVSELSPGMLGVFLLTVYSLPGIGITTFCTFSDFIIKGRSVILPIFAK